MPRQKVFISYNSQDRGPVTEIAGKLRAEGFDVWLDIWKLQPGDDWMAGLQQGLRECDCCAVFFGSSGTGPWQNQEIGSSINRAARSQNGGFRVIPVLLPGATGDLGEFLNLKVRVEFHRNTDESDAFEMLKWGISGQGPGPADKSGWNPYRGLEAFDVKDAPFFFGRTELIEQMLGRLQTMLNGSSNHKLLVLVGNSGCGKSSLARAGLIGAVKDGGFSAPGSAKWPAAIIKPGANPIENAAIELSALPGTPGVTTDARALRDALASGNQELNFFAKQLLKSYPPGSRLIMVIDQFEECFTNCTDSAIREKFFGNLVYAVEAADGPVLTILTLRADFYHECLHHAALGSVVSGCLFPVQPMNEKELRETIERPAQIAGLTFEPGLVDLLLSDLPDKASCLPLLQFTLTELCRLSMPRITLEAYNATGRVGGALAGKAEEAFNTLSPPEQDICHYLFLRLVRRTDRARYSSYRVALEELITSRASKEQIQHLLQKLTGEGRRLLTIQTEARLSGDQPQDEDQGQEDFVGLTHEVLIRSWPRFQQWLQQDSEFQLWHGRLSVSLDQWRNVNRKSEGLLRGRLLDEATGWQRRNQPDLNADENAFINQSRAHYKREMQLEWATLSVFLLLAGVLLYIWIDKTRVSYQQSQQLYAEALASIARNFDQSEIVRPLLISLYALERSENEETIEAVQDAVQRAGGPVAEHPGALKAISATQDGKLLAAAWDDGTVEFWQPRTDAPNGADPAHVYRKAGGDLTAQNGVSALAISSDGSRLAVAGSQPVIDLWDLPGRNHSSLEVPQGAVRSLDFNSSARQLLIASWENPVFVQSVGQAGSPQTIPNSQRTWQAVFCPTGKCAGLAMASGVAAIEDLAAASEQRLSQGTEAIRSIDFSPDGKSVAIGDSAGAVKIVSLSSGKELNRFAEDSGVARILFSPDGQSVVTMNSGGTASVWGASTGEQRMKLHGTEGFRSAAFARFGEAPHVVFGTTGGKLLIYDLDSRHLRKRAHEVWLANGQPALSTADCNKYLHEKVCPPLVWDK